MPTLIAQPREQVGKTTVLLAKEGRMPAVVYGHKQESTPISLSIAEFTKILRDEGESSVFDLEGLDKKMQVLIHDVDRDPVTNVPRHADLYAIEKGAKIEVAVPLSFVGESMAVKLGANLVKVLHELPVECAPADLPHEIEVDVASLAEVGDQITVGDLKLPKGVTAQVDAEDVVALTQEVAVEEETTETVDMGAIEVEKKGKDEEAEA